MDRNATALPCATSTEAEVWTATHERLKIDGWNDPALIQPGGVQRLDGEVYEVGHCRGCGSTLYLDRGAEIIAAIDRYMADPSAAHLTISAHLAGQLRRSSWEAVLGVVVRKHGALKVVRWTTAAAVELGKQPGQA